MSICQEGPSIDTGLPLNSKPIWNIEDLMTVTGYKRQTIYNKVSSKEIPHRRKGGRLYFFPNEILNWIDEGELE